MQEPLSSTAQRTTLVEHFCWGAEGQGLSRPLVPLKSSPAQVCLGASGEVGVFREVPAEKTVHFLVRSVLPWALQVAKADMNVCGDRELLVRRHPQPAGRPPPGAGHCTVLDLSRAPSDGDGIDDPAAFRRLANFVRCRSSTARASIAPRVPSSLGAWNPLLDHQLKLSELG